MKAPPFDYVRVTSLAHLLDLLDEHGGDAKILAGGQSLVPVLNLRLNAPTALLDIADLAELEGIAVADGALAIGARTRHRVVEQSPEVRRHAPLIAAAMPHVAHVAIRNRGTFGGSLCLADPAAELPACCVALGASFRLLSRRGERRVAAAEFFRGLYETALEPDEVMLGADVPLAAPDERFAFAELARRHGDYAIVGLCGRCSWRDERFRELRLVFFGVEGRPVLAARAAAAAEGRAFGPAVVQDVRAALAEDLRPHDDPQTSAATRQHLAGVLAGRALAAMAQGTIDASDPAGGL